MDSINELDRRLGAVVRQLRRDRDLTQVQLAERLTELLGSTVDQSAVSRIERGERQLTAVEFIAVAHVLKRSLDAIVKSARAQESRTRRSGEV